MIATLFFAPLLLAQPGSARPADTRPGIVITVEGIGGVDLLGSSAPGVLHKLGLPHEVHRFHWTHGTGKHLRDLQDTPHLVHKAEELAALIRATQERVPERPIYIVARSAGAAITLFALETLPPASVERVIFLSAAVSPTYDLRPALRAARLGIVSFHSTHDQLVLNWGTRNFGTADRFYGPGAGLRGFVIPAKLDADSSALYSQLVQIPWRSRMLLEGNNGGHFGTAMPTFFAAEVAPWLR